VSGLIYVGTSGWRYRDWASDFYADVPSKAWLKRYAERFDSVEVNGTFYREIRPDTLARWRLETPAHFRFSLKAHRYLTHVKRLRFEPESLERQKAAASRLGEKLSAMLWQLPPSLRYDPSRLDAFLTLLRRWPEPRHAMEFRHPSWFRDEVAEALGQNGHAVCLSDAATWPLWDRVTAGIVYVRLHGHEQTYRSNYSDSALADWAKRIGLWRAEHRTVHVYFDNTDTGAAWRNALRLREILAEIPLLGT
jgi:uncharacterized protein YecE (DUF72 family)